MLAGCNATTSGTTPASSYDGVDRSDVYPDITAPVSAATTQLTAEEVAAASSGLQALAARRASGAISEAEYRRRLAEMDALAAGHGAAALAA
ncbi:SHOCT domain-containing protein, partial [Rhizobium sp. TRM95111]|uniref:SHOCT domain-containing protein n=1 Tax=Rhizobium alarense TaxID=2846851 RepID=UPI001F3B1DC5